MVTRQRLLTCYPWVTWRRLTVYNPHMPQESIFARVEKATAWFPEREGQGVLVNDSLIMTAAHYIDHDSEGGMVLGDLFVEKIQFAYAVQSVGGIDDMEAIITPLADWRA